MEELDEEISAIQGKIERLNKFIALHLRRDGISEDIKNLVAQAGKVRDLLTKVHSLMQLEHNRLEKETKEAMSQMREKQTLLLEYLVKEKKRKLNEETNSENEIKSLLCSTCGNKPLLKSALKTSKVMNSAVKVVGFNLAQLQLQQQGNALTPKIKICDYKASPLVKKKVMPIPFQFTEFDVHITQQQFDKIPKYMCGRETLDQLNTFLETVIIPCFNEKYQLIHKVRSALRNNTDIELWKMYNDQASYLPGKMFITPGDITRIMTKMLDKKSQNRLTMLRHIGILQEQRVKQTVCLIWSHTGF